jgi:ssDNA thymidine ADP-ribosyltransferase DarT-like protein
LTKQNIDIGISGLYYITHIDNLMSIMKLGVLSHARVKKDGISFTPIYDRHIVEARKERIAPDGNSLWNFANLFFNPRNPMLYRLLREKPAKEIVVIALNPVILNKDGIFITTGNARALQSEILTRDEGLLKIKEFQKNFKLDRWAAENGSKTKIMAECLVPDRVPPEYLQEVYVVNDKVANDIKARYPHIKIDIVPEPYMFFRPSWHKSIANNLTISVNRVGIIGEGLNNGIKYHFIGVHTKYQDLSKQKKLLIKKEYSFDPELAVSQESMQSGAKIQFLPFFAKIHWVQRSDTIRIGKSRRIY